MTPGQHGGHLMGDEALPPASGFQASDSIADAYLGRAGFEYLVWPKYTLSFSIAGRIDGVPLNDLAGGSEGFRRPG